jgi:hypothetical protein
MRPTLLSIEQLLRSGKTLTEIATQTELSVPELSLLAKVLNIPIRHGRPRKQETERQNVS